MSKDSAKYSVKDSISEYRLPMGLVVAAAVAAAIFFFCQLTGDQWVPALAVAVIEFSVTILILSSAAGYGFFLLRFITSATGK
ncbi:MAG: hypothetical protein KAR11_05740, partial [Phycisphaerae bacterium]|nr:hypothetical protein [Phycisphaerae bacterium]